ncbi:hypothetical protein JXQ31_00730 [candidate division KSB1 bacterium]|nr:hypothetical protein [candidate division KSB1 bacterium]
MSDLGMKNRIYLFVLLFAFSLFYFIYFLLRVNPALIYQQQEPVFFFTYPFFKEFLTYPGGIADFIGSFLSQFYYYPWAGAVVLTVICWFVSMNTKWLLEKISGKKINIVFYIIPALFALALHSQYNYLLASSSGFIFSLLFFNLYLLGRRLPVSGRSILLLLLGISLYYIAGGFLLMFVVLNLFYELLFSKNYPSLVINIILLLLPYVAQNFLFLISLKDAYLFLLSLDIELRTGILSVFLYALYPVLLITVYFLLKKQTVDEKKREKDSLLQFKNKILAPFVQGAIIVFVFLFVVLYSFNRITKRLNTIDYLARKGMWQDILHKHKNMEFSYLYETYETNRALYFTGQLLEGMFSYPQLWGTDGLCLPFTSTLLTPLHQSDLDFDLGYVNESLHWAYEAVSVCGETSWNLQRLAILHILKNENQSAKRCLGNLEKTLQFRRWAKHYSKLMENESLRYSDPVLKHIYPRIQTANFMNFDDVPVANLEQLFKLDPGNKMAFEYLMAHYLMNKELNKIRAKLEYFKKLKYPALPRHIQEALMIYQNLTGQKQLLNGYKYNRKLEARFSAFQQVMVRFKNNKNAAQNTLKQSFGDTYWYYVLYPPANPEKLNL